MSQCIVIKKKDNIATLLAVRVSLNRARRIIECQPDKYAVYHIAEIIESYQPNYTHENRESIQENVD